MQSAPEAETGVKVAPVLAIEKRLARASLQTALMNSGHIVTVDPAIFVAILRMSLRVDREKTLGAITVRHALVEGALVGGGIGAQRLRSHELPREARLEPLVVADEEHSAARVPDIACLASRLGIAISASLADALETLASDVAH